jgi:hypothetical protein
MWDDPEQNIEICREEETWKVIKMENCEEERGDWISTNFNKMEMILRE